MDSAAKSKAAQDGISSGGMSPNEARKRYYALGPVTGGNSPMVQQQYYSLEALAERDANKPFAKPAAPAAADAHRTRALDRDRAEVRDRPPQKNDRGWVCSLTSSRIWWC
jgi:hypothetical protein